MKLTKSQILIAFLSLSGTAFSGTLGPICSKVNITIPCEKYEWDIGLKALALWPNYTDNYAFISQGADSLGNTYGRTGTLNTSWGFQIEGSYHFYTGNDINVNWYHLPAHTTGTNFTGYYFTPQIIPPVTNLSTVVLPYSSGSVSIQPRWDAVNVEIGQRMDLGPYSHLHYFGGLHWGSILTNYNLTATDVDNLLAQTPQFIGTQFQQSTYNGVGPRMGAEAFYTGWLGFSIYGRGAGALLIGQTKFNGLYTSNSTVIADVTSYGKKWTIVPELEAAVGVTYTCLFAQGEFKFDLGWMAANYFSAQLDQAIVGGTSTSDFGVQGPYVGLKWIGMVA